MPFGEHSGFYFIMNITFYYFQFIYAETNQWFRANLINQ